MPLRLYNTLTKKVEDFTPQDPSHIRFYTCGPTVYDDAHIGNFRSFLAADVLRRFLESPLCELANETPEQKSHRQKNGRRVTHVMNITDVGHMTDDAEGGEAGEDRMAVAGRRIEEAKKSGTLPAGVNVDPRDPYQIARFYEGRFREDARALGLKVSIEAERDESLHPKATANVPGMIAVIKRLLERNAGDGRPYAYVAGSPGSRAVYFRVRSFPRYGALSGNTLERLREGEGGRVNATNQSQKDHHADFLLWKEDPSHIMKWESPWGWGYPGWHIECTVMSLRAMQGSSDAAMQGVDDLTSLIVPDSRPMIDLHSGGEDNIFPHHECEIAQSCAAFNALPEAATFASMWFHPRFLLVEGSKMSKSKGNFYTARDLCGNPPGVSPLPGTGGPGVPPGQQPFTATPRPFRDQQGSEPWSALRLSLIRTHYRSNADFKIDALQLHNTTLDKWRLFARAASQHLNAPWKRSEPVESVGHYAERFADALHDDLQMWNAFNVFTELMGERSNVTTSLVLAGFPQDGLNACRAVKLPESPFSYPEIFEEWAKGKREGSLREWWALTHLLDSVMGIVYVPGINAVSKPSTTVPDIGVFAPGVSPDPAVESLLRDRRDARARKDFKASDAIRDQLAALGLAIKDMPGGKVEVRRAT